MKENEKGNQMKGAHLGRVALFGGRVQRAVCMLRSRQRSLDLEFKSYGLLLAQTAPVKTKSSSLNQRLRHGLLQVAKRNDFTP